MAHHNKFLILLAGGRGQRLWPITEHIPKYLWRAFSGKNLLELSLKRLKRFKENLLVVGDISCKRDIFKICRDFGLKRKMVIFEPLPRNTLPAVIYAINYIKHSLKKEEFSCAVIPTDHYIAQEGIFNSQLEKLLEFASCQDNIFLIGIEPTAEEENYGYIEIYPSAEDFLFKVRRFIEKPSRKVIKNLMRKKNILWNSGIFIFNSSVFVRQVDKILKGFCLRMEEYFLKGSLETFYKKIPSLQIDKEILQKSKILKVCRGRFLWSDVGNFFLIWRVLKKDRKGNWINTTAKNIIRDAQGNFIFSDSLNSLVVWGVSDMVVVESQGEVLIAPKSRVAHLKKLLKANEKSTLH